MIREGGRVEKFVAERKEALVKIYAVSLLAVHLERYTRLD